jgi:Tfp pilus assembly protein PilV
MRYQSGISLVEVVVGAAIITSFLLAALVAFQSGLILNGRNVRLAQATFLAEEGVEALKLMRDTSYSTKVAALSAGTTYYLEFAGGTWLATTTNVYPSVGFERRFVLSAVSRDNSTKDIVTSGGSVDASTTKAVVTVAWREGTGTTTRSISTYITNLFSN